MQYSCLLPADFADPESPHHFLDDLKPHVYFSKQQDDETTSYLLENFEQTLPRYQLRKRLKDYMDYLTDHDDILLIALFICTNTADLLYIKRRVRKFIGEEGATIRVRVTILDKVKVSGVASMIWEEVY